MRTRSILLTALALTLALPGCSVLGISPAGPGTGGHAPAATSPIERPAPTLPRLDLGAEPLASGLPSGSLIDPVVDGRMLSVTGTGSILVSVDLQTGKELWSRDTGGAFEGVGENVRIDGELAGLEDAALMRVTHYGCADDCGPGEDPADQGWGLVAMSPQDGSVAWSTVIAPPVAPDHPDRDYQDHLVIQSATVSSGVIVLGLEVDGDLRSEPPAGAPMQLSIGVDAASGKELWRTEGFVLDGRGVDVGWGELTDPSAPDAADEDVPALMDLRTGEILARTEHPGADIAGVGATGALLELEDEAVYQWVGPNGQDVPGGEVRGESDCARGPGPLTCTIGPDGVMTTLTEEGELVSAGPSEFRSLLFTDGDYVFAIDPTADLPPTGALRATVALDRSGNRLSDPVPGVAELRTGDLLLLSEAGADGQSVEVRSITPV
ncbi:outer membrane protein assembly factor BamB family protein [Brachybacterium hainanense]|uniref:PQQ-binding-like beta-propeller repeat protein n=1 Tax=Brachybacterium hainanense TaxID=1541174 RepID=A0ABV6RBD4_9MICO